MRKFPGSGEITRLNSACFAVRRESAAGDAENFWEEVLLRVTGGADALAACTEFTCNLYAPPPPPKV